MDRMTTWDQGEEIIRLLRDLKGDDIPTSIDLDAGDLKAALDNLSEVVEGLSRDLAPKDAKARKVNREIVRAPAPSPPRSPVDLAHQSPRDAWDRGWRMGWIAGRDAAVEGLGA